MAAKTDIDVSDSEYVQVHVNDSYTIALHETLLKQRETTLRADLERAHTAEKAVIQQKRGQRDD